MRIAYLSQSYPPMISGASLVAQRLAEGMCQRGHEILVISASDQGGYSVTSCPGMRVIRIRSFRNPFHVNHRFVLWPSGEVSAELRNFRPDVCHSHDPFSLCLVGALASRSMDTRPACVLTIHQLPWFVSSYLPPWPGVRRCVESLLWAYSRWICHFLDAMIAPSETVTAIAGEHLPHRPVVITNGVDLDTFSQKPQSVDEAPALRAKYDLDHNLPVIIYVGRIDADKRVDLVVRAAAKTMRSAEAHLLVVGNGCQLPEVIRLSEALGIRQFCRFPGYVAVTGDLPGLYRLSRVFVTASEVENQSSVIMEAAATGLPVVAVNAGSMPEFIVDGINGFLVQPRDIDAMSERMALLLKNHDLSRQIGQSNLELAQRHSSDQSLQLHEQFYATLVRDR